MRSTGPVFGMTPERLLVGGAGEIRFAGDDLER
jgi:hypothetical protein